MLLRQDVPSSQPALPGLRLKVLIALAAATILCMWVLPLRSSLWLDELVTYWSAYKGVLGAIFRSQAWPGQNIPYMVMVAAAMKVGGHSEIVLRLPSLAAALLTAWLLFRLGERFLDREAGLLAVVIFTCLHEIARDAAANARPYSIALLLAVAAVLQLVRWIDTHRRRTLAGFVLAAAAIPYFHYLFASMYLVFLVYGIYEYRVEHRVRLRELIAAAGFIAVLLSPLVWDFLHVHRATSQVSFAGTPEAPLLLDAFMPQALAASVFLAAVASWIAWRNNIQVSGELPSSAKVLLGSWLTIPILFSFVVARLTPMKIFVPRYYLVSFAALALILGCAIRMLLAPRVRIVLAAFMVLGSVVTYSGYHLTLSPHRENWRAAAQLVRSADVQPTTPVLVRVGLIETRNVHWPVDIDRDSPLLCPLSKYPVPGRVILLPYVIDDQSKAYLRQITSQVLDHSDRFVLMARGENVDFIAWAQGWFTGRNFVSQELGKSEGVRVFLFRRNPVPGGSEPAAN